MKYSIKVNGEIFEVEVESLASESKPKYPRPYTSTPKATPQVHKPVETPVQPAPTASPAAPAQPAVAGGSKTITAPMPANVLSVNVQVGDTVNVGDVVMLFEAMKMEVEVSATVAGKVASILVQKGATVNTGDTLIIVE